MYIFIHDQHIVAAVITDINVLNRLQLCVHLLHN